MNTDELNSFFRQLFAYNFHCNQQLANLLIEHETQVSEKSILLFSHILNAQHIWNSRMNAGSALHAVWDVQPLHLFRSLNTENHGASLAIINSVNLTAQVSYHNSRGSFTNCYRDMLFHIINHSTYHRAQIATECKLANIAPLASDYIFYKTD